MKYVWNYDSGMVPNIGVFSNGDEVPADVAKQLQDAGYDVLEVEDKPSKKVSDKISTETGE